MARFQSITTNKTFLACYILDSNSILIHLTSINIQTIMVNACYFGYQ